MKYVWGVDPGKRGALSILADNHAYITTIVFHKFSLLSLSREIEFCQMMYPATMCYIENVHAFPGQGRSSIFTFGRVLGNIEGLLTAARVPYDYVPPGTWQRAVSLGKKFSGKAERKEAQHNKASELFPGEVVTRDKADAILIAEYGYRKLFTNSSTGHQTP